MTVDARVDVKGVIGSPDSQIGQGNIANLIGNTKFSYPASGCHLDVITNGFTLTLDSGDGNAFSCTGSISGTRERGVLHGAIVHRFQGCSAGVGGRKTQHDVREVFRQEGTRAA